MRLPMVRDMEYLLRYSICLALNLPQISGSDYRMFAAEVGISKPELTAISRKGNPMEEVLTWWAAKNEATVDKMKGILLAMGREDVWEMLENSKAEELNLQRAQSAMADERWCYLGHIVKFCANTNLVLPKKKISRQVANGGVTLQR